MKVNFDNFYVYGITFYFLFESYVPLKIKNLVEDELKNIYYINVDKNLSSSEYYNIEDLDLILEGWYKWK